MKRPVGCTNSIGSCVGAGGAGYVAPGSPRRSVRLSAGQRSAVRALAKFPRPRSGRPTGADLVTGRVRRSSPHSPAWRSASDSTSSCTERRLPFIYLSTSTDDRAAVSRFRLLGVSAPQRAAEAGRRLARASCVRRDARAAWRVRKAERGGASCAAASGALYIRTERPLVSIAACARHRQRDPRGRARTLPGLAPTTATASASHDRVCAPHGLQALPSRRRGVQGCVARAALRMLPARTGFFSPRRTPRDRVGYVIPSGASEVRGSLAHEP
jgi:hypothetical protein